MLKRAENRLRLLGAFLLFSGLLSLLGIAVHFSPALLLAAAFIAAFGGAALLAGFVRRPAARARAAEPLVLDRIAPDWTAQLEALQTEARALQSQARRLIAERPHDPAEVRAEASEQLARQADAIVRQMEEAEESAERVRDGIEALRSGASAADPALSTLNELAARGNLLALNAAIAGARGDGRDARRFRRIGAPLRRRGPAGGTIRRCDPRCRQPRGGRRHARGARDQPGA
ncbi:MAG: hypothetical protein WDN72_06400 [Alphaproteobacteria bacterium]